MTTSPSGKEPHALQKTKVAWLDRDLSLLAFNARVLDWAKRPEVPLLERLRYLCIVSSNLDEFFEVRAALYASLDRPLSPLDSVGLQAQGALSKGAIRALQRCVDARLCQSRRARFVFQRTQPGAAPVGENIL